MTGDRLVDVAGGKTKVNPNSRVTVAVPAALSQ